MILLVRPHLALKAARDCTSAPLTSSVKGEGRSQSARRSWSLHVQHAHNGDAFEKLGLDDRLERIRSSMAAARLHDAVRQDKCRLVAKLISEGAFVDAVDANGNTALFNAIREGSPSVISVLLQAGANPNFRCSGLATPVHAACRRGSRSLLQQLLECGGDLRLRDERGRTPQDWAMDQGDPQCRRKLVTFINTKRAIAYRFDDPSGLLEDDPPAADASAPGASLRRRLGRGRKFDCVERLKADGGFGVVYCSPSKETGASTYIPFVSSVYLYSSDEGTVTWSGPQSVVQTMYWEKLKVSVKKSSLNGSNCKGPRSDVLITELENIRKMSYHPYFLWPLAVSPVQNMDDIMLVYELAHYGSLFDVLHNSQPLADGSVAVPSKNQQVVMMQQVCEALLFLHSRKLLHGCISSHCVYAVMPFLGKLGGFEFLCPTGEDSHHRNYIEPSEDVLDYYYHWMAPEVLAGRRPTRASDLYQMCVVLWEVFSEDVPWESVDRSTVYRHLVQEKNRLPTGLEVPSPLAQLVDAGLAPNPEERDTDIEEIYEVLSVMVHESFLGSAGLSLSRRDGLTDLRKKGSGGGKASYPPRQTTMADDQGSYVPPQFPTRKQSSVMLDNMSDAFMDDLISLADDDSPKMPHRRRRVMADLGSKFDGISITSSVDPMEYADAAKLPTFSSQQERTEAFTQTDGRPAPLPRPRTGPFGAASSMCSIKPTPRSSNEVGVTATRSEGLKPVGISKEAARLPRPAGFVSRSNIRSRNVRPFKPASHKCELSPFIRYGQLQRAATVDARAAEKKSKDVLSPRRAFGTEGRGSQGDAALASRSNLHRMDGIAYLEDFKEESEIENGDESTEQIEAQTAPKVTAESQEATGLYPGLSSASAAILNEEGYGTDNEVKSVQTEPNHTYKVQVVTMTCPVVQHTLTVTSTNLVTGETTVTEESTNAEVVHVQWKPEEKNISIATPDVSGQALQDGI